MIKDITIGQYVPGDSFMHKLDARVKILLSILFVIELFIVNNFEGYIFIIPFTVFIVLISKLRFKYIYKGLKPIFLILLITSILNVFMYHGETLIVRWKFITIYKEGIYSALFIILRLVFLIVGTSLVTLTTSPIELTDGIEKLLNPFKKIGLPAHEFAMMMTIALRFIPTLIDETDKIMKAQISRGADFESGNIFSKAKNLIPLLIPLFINSFRRADDLAMAMESRCYRGGKGRTRMKQLKVTYKDIIAITVFLMVSFIAVSCKWWLNI